MRKKLSPRKLVAQRYGVSVRTLLRWEGGSVHGFPRGYEINGRHYHDDEELDNFDASLGLRNTEAA